MKVKNLLPTEAAQILSEDSLNVIEEAFTKKLKLAVESALTKQDDLYAKKLQQLIGAIDKDHSIKLKRVVESIDRNNGGKLLKVIRKYERELNVEAKSFKKTLVGSISNYLEEFIDEAIPKQAIEEATKNRTAREVLGNLRKVLAIDSALMKESVQVAVVDGKKQIDELAKQVDRLTKENTLIKENYLRTKSALILENKIHGLSSAKQTYIKRVLGDKSPKFIEENFDYTLRLFDKKEKERISTITDQAFSGRTVKADAPVLTEQNSNKPKQPVNPYITELEKYR